MAEHECGYARIGHDDPQEHIGAFTVGLPCIRGVQTVRAQPLQQGPRPGQLDGFGEVALRRLGQHRSQGVDHVKVGRTRVAKRQPQHFDGRPVLGQERQPGIGGQAAKLHTTAVNGHQDLPTGGHWDSPGTASTGHCLASAATANAAAVCRLHLGFVQGLAQGIGGTEVADLVVKNPRRVGCRLVIKVT